jgi:hypothetical protein
MVIVGVDPLATREAVQDARSASMLAGIRA